MGRTRKKPGPKPKAQSQPEPQAKPEEQEQPQVEEEVILPNLFCSVCGRQAPRPEAVFGDICGAKHPGEWTCGGRFEHPIIERGGCCYRGCSKKADWNIEFGRDYTERTKACHTHLHAMLNTSGGANNRVRQA